MTYGRSRLVLALATVALSASGGSSILSGCASPDCSETETCPPIDGSLDQIAPDTGYDAGDASDGGETGADATDGDATDRDAPQDARDAAPDQDAAETGGKDAGPETGADASDGCVKTPENCTDGVDNDCDGYIDCADSDCQAGYQCAAPAPPGWFGPGAFFPGSSGTAPSCVAPYSIPSPIVFESTPSYSPATCSCTCGPLANACTSAGITVFSDNVCHNVCGAAGPPGCTNTGCAGGGQSAGVTTQPQPSANASCDAGVVATTSSYTWSNVAQACGPSQSFRDGGCGVDTCVANPPAGALPKPCIWKTGAATCSASTTPGYPLAYTYYQNAVDTRGCSLGSCSCGANVTSCSVSATAYASTTSCSGTGRLFSTTATLSGSTGCNDIGAGQIGSIQAVVTATGGCTASGKGTPTGDVHGDPNAVVTVCCAQ